MLCELCSKIHFKPLGVPALDGNGYHNWGRGILFYFHHKNESALRASAEHGCYFCIMLWRVLAEPPLGKTAQVQPMALAPKQVFLFFRESPSTVSALHGCMDIFVECAGLVIRGKYGFNPQGNVRAGVPLAQLTRQVVKEERQDASRWIILDNSQTSRASFDLDKTTMSPANIVLARTWLTNCMDCHSPCSRTSTVLPRRVVDLTDPKSPRLACRDGLNGQYVALSYKWGLSQRFVTTVGNLEQRMHLIRMESLPQTFQNAIEVTHSLGFQYLWIDALCIIQDSADDLDTDINSMDQVYQNAALTIFAAGADDANSGLSVTRNPWETKPCQLGVKFTEMGLTIDTQTLISFYEDYVPSGRYPLFDRGWVLQEQLMSRRCLIFGNHFMSWECLCAQCTEKWPTVTGKIEEISDPLQRSDITIESFPEMRKIVAHKIRGDHRVLSMWYRMTKKENYTRRNLSYPSDVLQAVCGLSNALGRLYGLTYAFGLWLEDLHRGLACSSCESLKTSGMTPPPSAEHAQNGADIPSWTWASNWGREVEFRSSFSGYFEYEGRQDRSDRPFDNNLANSALKISGHLKPAKVLSRTSWTAQEQLKLAGYVDTVLERPLWLGSVHDVTSGEMVGRIAFDENPETVNVSIIGCLLWSMGWQNTDKYLTCLALVPVSESHAEYRRVGLIFLDKKDWFRGLNDFAYGWGPYKDVSDYMSIRLV